ncbi:hypothetical protein [Arthrobacter sp. ES1]|uniref:hypothetical protein n=1 Tax=Arthrobacter sp. ES1 TaxID=1897056 RepID=UPI001CFF8544|nr:hypothetical protein [Arthrobacter sp. ES1]MCB5280365.1 hypothetical protein [Arthrobacter sp. ES1]
MMKTTISHKRSRRGTEVAARTGRPGLIKRITATVLMLLLTGVAALALSSPAKAAEDPLANYSFYKLSSSLAAFFSNAKSPAAAEKGLELKTEVWNPVLNDPGSAGSMLGYVDPNFSFSMEFLNSQISGSSAAVGYNTLIQSSQGGGASSTATPGMLDYAHFGATLNAMGLDSMSTGLSLNIFLPIGGGLMMLLYIFTGVVDLLFTGIISTLKGLNPFTLFYEGVKAVSPKFADGMTGGQTSPDFLGGLSSWIGQWYRVLNGLSWAVLVPLFIGVLLLGLLLHKNMNRGSAIRKLLIRLVFIGVGLPLVGSMYTGVLNAMGDTTKGGSAGSTQVVLSTYVDFQNWVLKNRLYVPTAAVIEWDATGHKPTAKALANVRNTALEINKATNPAWAGINSTLNVAADKSWTDAAIKDTEGDAAGGLDGYMGTIDLLARYMGGAKVEAASLETDAKGDISTSSPYTDAGGAGQKQVDDWFIRFGDPRKGLPAIDDRNVVANNPVIRVADGTGMKASPKGATKGDKTFTSPSQWGCNAFVSNGRGEPLNCNMSSLSLYNYLNTSFGTNSMTMYSSNKASSGATREMHTSVAQVGTGTMSGLYWLNSMVLLASFVIIGIGYAFSMLFANVKRSFQLVTAIPFATMGALPGIAKVVIYTLAMIMEVILTLFIYRFMQVFLISIPQIVEMPFSAVLNSTSALGDGTIINLLTGGTLSMVMTVLSIIALLIFTVLALKTRKTLVKSINEVVTKLVDKFMETNVAPPGGKGGLMPALAGGMASGAGMAAANKVMTGSPGGGKKSAGPGNGPGGITAGGIPASGGPGGPNAGGPAGELTVGGGAGMDVSGAVGDAGPDGSGGTPGGGPGRTPGGNGSPGSPLAIGPGPSSGGSGGISGAASSDQSTAKAVAAQGGLSEPGTQGGGGITDSMAGPVGQAQAPQGSTDPEAGAGSGAGAVVKGAEAAGRGLAGNAAGAAAAGMAAVGHARDAQNVKASPQAKPAPKRPGASAQGTRPLQAPASRPRQAPKTGPAPAPKQAPRQTPKQAPKPAPAAPSVKQVPTPGTKPAPRVLPTQTPVSRPQEAVPKQAPRPVRKNGDA